MGENGNIITDGTKHGFNKVYGWRFKNIHISIKNLETIKLLINNNYNFLKKHNLNTEWSKLLDISIENEKNRQSKTMCFLCCKKGHFAINCKEDYDIDGEYIGNQNKSKHNKKVIKKNLIIIKIKNLTIIKKKNLTIMKKKNLIISKIKNLTIIKKKNLTIMKKKNLIIIKKKK